MLSWFFVFFGGREMPWRPEVQGLEDAAAVTAVWLSTQRLHMPDTLILSISIKDPEPKLKVDSMKMQLPLGCKIMVDLGGVVYIF